MFSSRSSRHLALPAAIVVTLLVAACSNGTATPAPSASSTPSSSAPSTGVAPSPSTPDESIAPTKLVVGLGYIPSVQFAQFYLAQQKGYYTEAGLDVEFQNSVNSNLIPLVGQGAIDIGIGDGTDVIPAVSNGIPIEYVATIYGKFPNVVFAKASSGIKTAADLKGKKIGVPGKYGSGWIMLQALLASAKLTTDDVDIVEYPDFTQEIAVEQGAVDAATGFANNEPIQLERTGTPTFVLHVDDVTPLPGPGLIGSFDTVNNKHDAVAGFVRATLRAMEDVIADPSKGVDAAIAVEPTLGQDRDLQTAILDATIKAWEGSGGNDNLGVIDRNSWQKSIDFMTSLGLVPNPVTIDEVVVEDFVTAS